MIPVLILLAVMIQAHNPVTIAFPADSARAANQLAEDLRFFLTTELARKSVRLDARIERESEDTLDLGTLLVILLHAPAVIVLANAVRDWAKRKRQSTIQIGNTRIDNLDSCDVADVITALKEAASIFT